MSTPRIQSSADPNSVDFYAPKSFAEAAERSTETAGRKNQPWIGAESDERSRMKSSASVRVYATEMLSSLPDGGEDHLHSTRHPRPYWWVIFGTIAAGTMLLAIILAPFLGPISKPILALGKPIGNSLTPQTDGSGARGRSDSLDRLTSFKVVQMPAVTVTNGAAHAGLPQALGIVVSDAAPGSQLHLTGVTKGTRVTAGRASGADDWDIPVEDLPRSFLTPPSGFTGEMNIRAELRTDDGRVLARSPLQLTWSKPPPAASTDAATGISGPSVTGPQESKTEAAHPKQNIPETERAVGAPPIGPEEVALLLQTAQQLTSQGDIASARIILQRLAANGNANAAYELAATYDPAFSWRLKSIGAKPNIDRARSWYEKARAWGSKQAANRLEQIGAATNARATHD